MAGSNLLDLPYELRSMILSMCHDSPLVLIPQWDVDLFKTHLKIPGLLNLLRVSQQIHNETIDTFSNRPLHDHELISQMGSLALSCIPPQLLRNLLSAKSRGLLRYVSSITTNRLIEGTIPDIKKIMPRLNTIKQTKNFGNYYRHPIMRLIYQRGNRGIYDLIAGRLDDHIAGEVENIFRFRMMETGSTNDFRGISIQFPLAIHMSELWQLCSFDTELVIELHIEQGQSRVLSKSFEGGVSHTVRGHGRVLVITEGLLPFRLELFSFLESLIQVPA